MIVLAGHMICHMICSQYPTTRHTPSLDSVVLRLKKQTAQQSDVCSDPFSPPFLSLSVLYFVVVNTG